MVEEQQEIESYVTLIQKWEALDDKEIKKKAEELILDFASFLKNKGYRVNGIYDEIVHLLRGVASEFWIRTIISPPSISLKVYDSYTKDMSSNTAYIHRK